MHTLRKFTKRELEEGAELAAFADSLYKDAVGKLGSADPHIHTYIQT